MKLNTRHLIITSTRSFFPSSNTGKFRTRLSQHDAEMLLWGRNCEKPSSLNCECIGTCLPLLAYFWRICSASHVWNPGLLPDSWLLGPYTAESHSPNQPPPSLEWKALFLDNCMVTTYMLHLFVSLNFMDVIRFHDGFPKPHIISDLGVTFPDVPFWLQLSFIFPVLQYIRDPWVDSPPPRQISSYLLWLGPTMVTTEQVKSACDQCTFLADYWYRRAMFWKDSLLLIYVPMICTCQVFRMPHSFQAVVCVCDLWEWLF